MGSKVRRVPADWKHPKDSRGRYIPQHDGTTFERRAREWDIAEAKWKEGLVSFEENQWEPIDPADRGMTYAEFSDERPDPAEFTPQWPASQCTHWQLYEDVTEGTPKSPVSSTPEELAQWMVDNHPSATFPSYQDCVSYVKLGRIPT